MRNRMSRLPPPWGRRLDRDRPVSFEFDGKRVNGFAGDTIASSVYADPQHLDYLARSFKYHRPRGIGLGAGLDANQYVKVDGRPNVPADNRLAKDGMVVTSQNVFGTLQHDFGSVIGALSRFLPAGFYYDAFFRPKGIWPFWERIIRRFAGLGVLDPDSVSITSSDRQNLFCEVAVIGGGVSGMAAALRAAKADVDVILIERDCVLGGQAGFARLSSEERTALEDQIKQIKNHPRITVLDQTFCAGWFSGNTLTAHGNDTYYSIRAEKIVIAAGAVEQPLVFRNNDLPGIIFATTANRLMREYAILPGQRAVIQTANRFGYETALTLKEAGCDVLAILDMRTDISDAGLVQTCKDEGIQILSGETVIEAFSGRDGRLARLASQQIAGDGKTVGPTTSWSCDTLVTSIGFSPLMQLVCHSGGEVIYDPERASLAVSKDPPHGFSCGALKGHFEFSAAMKDGVSAAEAALGVWHANAKQPSRAEPVNFPWTIFPHPKGKEFVDFDEDQTIGDINDAVAAGFDHMELMKRYTTTGMGPSQGRTTALNALRVFSAATGNDLAALRITTQRPPFEPEPFSGLAAGGLQPLRRTILDTWHRSNGAEMKPFGSWLRPAFYRTQESEVDCIDEEALAVRLGVGLFDASTHGGFYLSGVDWRRLLDLAYINDLGDFSVGETRQLLMTNELGAVVDDCVACRLTDHSVYLVTSSGASAATNRTLRKLSVEYGLNVAISEWTGSTSVLHVSGPLARDVVQGVPSTIDFSRDAFPLHAFRSGEMDDIPVIVLRGGFLGELTYEIHLGTHHAGRLWARLLEAGQSNGIRPIGVMAQRILRAECSNLIIGQDTDFESTPDDLGYENLVDLSKPYFVGKSAIEQLRLSGKKRRVFPVEMEVERPNMPEENSLLERNGQVVGRITSLAYSPLLGRAVGLASVEKDKARAGDSLSVWGEKAARGEVALLDLTPYDPYNERQAV